MYPLSAFKFFAVDGDIHSFIGIRAAYIISLSVIQRIKNLYQVKYSIWKYL